MPNFSSPYRRQPARGYFRRVIFEPLEPRSLLAPLTNVGTASDIVFNLPATASTVILEDDGIAGNGISQLRSTNGTFDTTTFANPSGLLTLNRGNATDTITIAALPDYSAGLTIGSAARPLGSIVFAGAVSLAANNSLSVFATGMIKLEGSQSDLQTSGTGLISLTTARNIALSPFSSIITADGDLTLSANQQAPPTTGGFAGIDLNRATVQVTGTGKIALFGRGGGALSTSNHGIQLKAGAVVGSTSPSLGAGTITLQGTVGEGSQTSAGVALFDNQTSVSSVTGNITITGLPAETAASTNWGILMGTNVSISSTGLATISLTGNGGRGLFNNDGIVIAGEIRSAIGDVTLTGYGGTARPLFSQDDNDGIEILGTIESTGTANITIVGQGGSGSFSNDGVQIEGVVKSASGNITISGTGGLGTTRNNGIRIEGTVGSIHSVDGDISISGVAGSGTSGLLSAVGIGGAGIHSSGSARISINGSGALNSYAVALGGPITSASPIQITGRSGANGCGIAALGGIDTSLTGANVGFITDCILFGPQPINAGIGTATIHPLTAGYAVDLGGVKTFSPLSITDAELDAIIAASVQIGDASSGPITVSADISRAAATNVTLTSGSSISLAGGAIDTAGGNLVLAPGGSSSVSAAKAGNDVNLGATGRLSFATGSDLTFAINGTTLDTEYQQLNLVGEVNLTSADLVLSLSYTPVVGNGFVLINNDASDAITGTFNGLPEGSIFNFPVTATRTYQITYRGGDGNDVVLTAVNTSPTFVVGTDASATDESGPQTIMGWATAISAGPPGEAGQQVNFVVTGNTNEGLFAALPTIDAAGNLAFTPAPNAAGSAQVTIVLKDDGGTASGGVDTSNPQTFAINITKPHRWHNTMNPFEVIGDDQVAPDDALAVINYLNSFRAGPVPQAAVFGPPYYDVDGDGYVAPIDALIVINYLNARGSTTAGAPAPEGESEAASPAILVADHASKTDWLTLLAQDVATCVKTRITRKTTSVAFAT